MSGSSRGQSTAIATGSLLITPYGRAALFGLGYHVCRSLGGPVVIGGLIGYGLARLVRSLRSSG